MSHLDTLADVFKLIKLANCDEWAIKFVRFFFDYFLLFLFLFLNTFEFNSVIFNRFGLMLNFKIHFLCNISSHFHGWQIFWWSWRELLFSCWIHWTFILTCLSFRLHRLPMFRWCRECWMFSELYSLYFLNQIFRVLLRRCIIGSSWEFGIWLF